MTTTTITRTWAAPVSANTIGAADDAGGLYLIAVPPGYALVSLDELRRLKRAAAAMELAKQYSAELQRLIDGFCAQTVAWEAAMELVRKGEVPE